MSVYFDREYDAYVEFIKEYFPKSSFLNEIGIYKKNISKIFKAIKMIEVVKDIETNDDLTTELLDDISLLFSRLLYIMPTNDYYFISVVFRGLSETILKLFYHQAYPEKSSREVRNINYRNLWGNGIKNSDIYNMHKTHLDKLSSLFVEHSNSIHIKNKLVEPIPFLTSIAEGETKMKSQKLNSHIFQVVLPVIDYFGILLYMDINKLPMFNRRLYRDILK